jgi:S-adenosylmethionine hydrolase
VTLLALTIYNASMIVLFTDFGLEGPYTGQVKAVLAREAPGVPVIDLMADAPIERPMEAAYLLAAYAPWFPADSVHLCVVDPGVGTDRPAEAVRIDGRWLVGPGNGLFEPLLRRAGRLEGFAIPPAPVMSVSFHGRDLFAPVAGKLASGLDPAAIGLVPKPPTRRPDWPDELAAIVYLDRYGNAMTGLRAKTLGQGARLAIGGCEYARARIFGDVPEGHGFWYENANGLAEIAVNRGRADALPGVQIGAAVVIAGL